MLGTKSERIGLMVTMGVHAAALLLAMLYTFENTTEERSAFIEVTLGEYALGKPTELAPQENAEIRTRRKTSEESPTKEPEKPTPTKEQTATTKEQVKDVDLADQKEPVNDEKSIKTPEAEEIDPSKRGEKSTEETIPTLKAKEADQDKEGAEQSGAVDGFKGSTNSDQGTGNDEDKSAPFKLEWEGDIRREPRVQPLPTYNAENEAVITVRFQVKPDGTVGQMIVMRKMNPELEREVLRSLRTWRFSKLPSGVPQTVQWGTITFRFVLG